MSNMLDSLPPQLRRFAAGRWPWVWLAAACALGVFGYAIPAFLREAELRQQATQLRALVAKQETVAALGPTEESRRAVVAAWWRDSAGQRVRAANQAAAVARLQEHVRTALTQPAVRIEKMEAGSVEPLIDAPSGSLVKLSVTLACEHMESLAAALAALEGDGKSQPAPWLRIGNMKLLATGVRYVNGVKVEMTIYAIVEAAAGA